MATEDESNQGTPSSSAVSPMAYPNLNSPSNQSLNNGITRSAFEITSVSNAEPDDLEVGVAPSSKDAEEMKSVLTRDKKDSNRFSSSSGDSEVVDAESQAERNSIDHLTGEAHPLLSSIPSNPSPKPPLDGNGPLQGGSSRFRRVNVYPRGRWSVRDIYEPDERHESDSKVASSLDGSSGISPSLTRKQPPPPSSLTTSEYSHEPKAMVHSRSNSEASHISEHLPHLPRDPSTLSERSSSILVETAPSLSRTESSSSLMTKSVDEEVEPESHSRDIDNESIASSIPNTHTPDIHSTMGTSSTAERTPVRHCEACSLRYVINILRKVCIIYSLIPLKRTGFN